MNRIIVSEEYNPYYNLALEEDLLRDVNSDEVILYLWQNEKTVVIGRNQNPFLECDISQLTAGGVRLARRISGGGAVYHDLGNLNFTFIYQEHNKNLEQQLHVIKQAVEALGVTVEFSGRNDLTIQGQKFSGHAFYAENGHEFHHGTLMVDVDLSQLGQVLRPSKLKMQAKGVTSVKSRVVNLQQLVPSCSVNQLIDLLVASFGEIYGDMEKPHKYNSENYIPTQLSKYEDSKWIYGESPKYDVMLERRISQGMFQALLQVENGGVQRIKIHTDSLSTESYEQVAQQFTGRLFDLHFEDQLFGAIEDWPESSSSS
ncbi:lipoate--protein ligase [Paenibacillus motobuensis]|uniref:lipoate--protein ligase n=1 Tax=Paenibacillus TaxID=44249 RepID=UPI00203E4519|nr:MULTISPECIES: lipoate--protein ligase [Paenibacillus]MCM3039415.1 lipoate--protein ligase [Paenibacillus lutimineralis]MCM3646519.1 lipoate--protein ligase [Paenibacillus motobuensis]